MPPDQTQRPKFYEEQYLGAADLNAAVDYGHVQQARHALGAHTWGIAAGLQLQEKDSSAGGGQVEVFIQPGYAWDGFGRPIVVLAPYRIPAELFKSILFDANVPAGQLIKVWLRYDEAATQRARSGFEVCDRADQFSRVQETFRVEIGDRNKHEDRHNPISVAGYLVDAEETLHKLDPTDPNKLHDESVPYQNFPEAGQPARWLIPLGAVRWQSNSDPNQPGAFAKRSEDDLKISRSLRRYIGVVAESVQAADGILRLRDRMKVYSQVQSNDLVWVEGSLRVEGDVRLFGGRLDFRHLDGQDFAVPLHIRRTGDPGPGARSLQISLGPDTQSTNRLAVGALKTDNTLDEKFVVLSGGNVGIGTTVPAAKLEITADWTGEEGTLRLTGDKPTIRFTGGAVAGGHSWLLHLGSDGPGNLQFFRRSGAATWTNVLSLSPGGNVGIGTSDPQFLLHVQGNAAKPGGGPWSDTSSDARLKKNIEPLTGALSRLLQLRGVRFEWTDPEQMGNLTGPQMGFVAQEVETVFPEWVSTTRGGYRSLTIRGFEALTIEALRELRGEIESLRTRLEAAVGNQPVASTRPRRKRG